MSLASYDHGRNMAQFMDREDDPAGSADNLTTEELIEIGSRLDDMLEAMTAEYIAPVKAQLDTIKDQLKARALAAGTTLASDIGRVEFVRAGERVTWDDAALLLIAARLAESQPELCAQVIACRRATAVEASARVRFAPKG
jgi:hypothetical protein